LLVFWMVDDVIARARGTAALTRGRERPVGPQDDVTDQGYRLLVDALAADQRGDTATAGSWAVDAVELFSSTNGVGDDVPYVWAVAADLVRVDGPDDAWDRLVAVTDEGERVGVLPLALGAHRLHHLGVRQHEAGDLETAERSLRAAIEDFRAWGGVPFRARAEADLARCLRALGRDDEADAVAASARAVLESLGAAAWLRELDGSPVRG